MEYKDLLKEIIVEICPIDISHSEILDSSDLNIDFNFNSIEFIELIVELETRFGIEFEDEDMDIEKLVIYSSLSNLIERRINDA